MQKKLVVLFFPKSMPDRIIRRFPNAVYFLERMISDLNVETIIIDQNIHDDYKEIIISNAERLVLVGISSMTGYQIKEAIEFSKFVKENSKAKVLWGGWHTTLLPEQVLSQSYVDFIIKGQGEIPFRELVKEMIQGNDISHIIGCGHKSSGNLLINNDDSFENPNIFPPIDYSKINLEPYIYKSKYSTRTFEFFASYGCPYNCGFCSLTAIYKRKWFHREVDEIIANLKYFQNSYGINCIKFDDDNFFVSRKFTIELCNAIIESGIKIKWFTSAHANHFLKHFGEEDFQLMKKSGLIQIFVGAESGDQEVLDLIEKSSNVDDNIKIIRLLKKYNLQALFSVIFCFPINPDKDFTLTLKMLTKAKLIMPELKFLIFSYIPYPGTKLFDYAINNGYEPPKTIEEWACVSSKNNQSPWFKKHHLKTINIYNDFYFNIINPFLYKKATGFSKILIFITTLFFYPLTFLRFKTGFLKFPIEAIVFLSILKLLNKILNSNLKLKPEGEDQLSL